MNRPAHIPAPRPGEKLGSTTCVEHDRPLTLAEPVWIAVFLPALILQAAEAEATEAERESERPSVVVESAQGRLGVVAADRGAGALGVEPGLNLTAAFAYSGALRVLERSPERERVRLETLAAACTKLTPEVSLEPPDSLLLEVRASLRLFGGLTNLIAALTAEIDSRGGGFRLAVAPTPLGAVWLARYRGGRIFSKSELPSSCGALPLAVTRWPEPVRSALRDMGVETIGDCLRLPRDGFARRLGKTRLDDLDKALGRCPDPRLRFESPDRLHFDMELADGSTSVPVFIAAAERMTRRLAEELQARQAQVRTLRWTFRHRRQSSTVCTIELLEASADRLRLLELCSDRIERVELPAPAVSLELSTGALWPAELCSKPLFKGAGLQDDEASMRLVERLRGRLGSGAVRGLSLAAEHRPEKAWLEVDAGSRCASSVPVCPWAADRPLWLLRKPQPLPSMHSRPWLDGAVCLPTDAERIESGWWDGEDVSRDYFAATTPRGERLWIFRDRAEDRWYLHGYFG